MLFPLTALRLEVYELPNVLMTQQMMEFNWGSVARWGHIHSWVFFFPVFLTKTPWLPWEIHMPASLALVVPSVHTAHSVPPDLKVFCSPTHSLLYHVNWSKKRLSNQSLFNKQCYQCLGDSCTVYDMGTSGHLLACINWHGNVVFWPGTPDRKLNLQNQTVVIYIPWCPPRWATGLHANNF